MAGIFHGVFIGINHYQDERSLNPLNYAEKDANDVKSVLSDREIGFPSQGTFELLCGEHATKHNIEGTLENVLIKNCNSEDTVVVYFSGHGFFTGDSKTAYIGTYDTKIADIAFNPYAGLRMEDIYNKWFQRSPAVRILFILDCCHSEAFIPPSKSAEPANINHDQINKSNIGRDLIDNTTFPQAEGRVAIFSSPSGLQSNESDAFQNGIFTHYVVLGLRGAAAENETGEVTIESLMSYVKLKVPTTQPAGFAGKMVHRFVLTRNHQKFAHSRPQFTDKAYSTLSSINTNPQASTGQIDVQPLASPFDACLPFIDSLVARISEIRSSIIEPGSQILEVVRKLYDAKLVFVLRIQNNKPDLRFYNEADAKGVSLGDLISKASQRIITAMEEKRFHKGNIGLFHHLPIIKGTDWGPFLPSVIIIPLKSDGYSDFMVIFGTPTEAYLGELFAQVLKTLYFVTNELTIIPFDPKTLLPSAVRLKASILDGLKSTYGYVPFELYEKRFELFQQSLKETKVAFEPILYLDPVHLHIWGWECLAREDGADHAPVHLFKSAELWGSKFMVELDIHFIRLATHRYRELLAKNKIKQGHELPLSVNVYPASLMRSAYKKAVSEIIVKENLILGEKLVMEISEKLPIVADTPMSDAKALETFKNRIVQYTTDYRINFAIDDFGVGYSSVSRLANLNPYYVKIDRDILLQKDFCDLTLKYVKQMVDVNKTSPPVVVIEGFDGSTDMAVSLKRLYDDGIRYVQGYVIGRAGPELYELNEEVESFLKRELE